MDFYTEDQKLSSMFTVGDLTVTTKVLALPNLPTQKFEFDNLVILADVLQYIHLKIGPFVIISGYRTAELQRALEAAGEPVSKTKSFHEVGRAADIYPANQDLAEFFGRILADEYLRRQFSEISIKPSQGAIHLAVNVPGDVRTPRILTLNANKQYVPMTEEQIESYVSKYSSSPEVLAETIHTESEGSSLRMGIVVASAAALASLLFLFS